MVTNQVNVVVGAFFTGLKLPNGSQIPRALDGAFSENVLDTLDCDKCQEPTGS